MNRKIVIILLSVAIILCLIILLMYQFNIKKLKNDNYIMHYYKGHYVYDIKMRGNNLYIDKNEIIQCVTVPCNPRRINSVKIKNTEEYQNFIESMFREKEDKDISILDSNLSGDELKIITKIIKKNNK